METCGICNTILDAIYCPQCNSVTGTIVSPVTGYIAADEKSEVLGIYVPRDSDHKLWSPITGIVQNVEEKNGLWTRTTNIFEVPINQKKTGSVTVSLYGLVNVKVEIEVGYSKYITNKVLLNLGKDGILNQSASLGTIVIGSYVNLQLPEFAKFKLMVKKGDKVQGGKTICARWTMTNPILLTVPHAKCLTEQKSHICDYAAMPNALSLARQLFHTFSKDVIVLPGNINRSTIDLNRIESRPTVFRQWVSMFLPIISRCYDIHSFPPGGSWTQKKPSHPKGPSSLKKKVKKKCKYVPPIKTNEAVLIDDMDVVILEDLCELDNASHSSFKLLKFLMPYKKSMNVALLQGAAGYNDIMDEVESHKKECFLIEYNEATIVENREIQNHLIASWISSCTFCVTSGVIAPF